MNEVTTLPAIDDDATAGALMLLVNYGEAASRGAWAKALENSQTGFDFDALAPVASAEGLAAIDEFAAVLLEAGLITEADGLFTAMPTARDFLVDHGLFKIREA